MFPGCVLFRGVGKLGYGRNGLCERLSVSGIEMASGEGESHCWLVVGLGYQGRIGKAVL